MTYRRRDPRGLANQGWKDSWDGVTFADGSLAEAPIALIEVQGYAYDALRGAAAMAAAGLLQLDPADLERDAARLRARVNEQFWDPRGWFVLGLDGAGRRIDALTTNPGHALWSGIAEPELADRYLDRISEPDMWTGWGLRTLAATMGAYDPLSYHNGSVWPHDTAICAAGAARYGRWDVVDRIADGLLDATMAQGARPPELFAGIGRDDIPVPVAYPASCSPQAWSAASVLLLVRSVLGLEPEPRRHHVATHRPRPPRRAHRPAPAAPRADRVTRHRRPDRILAHCRRRTGDLSPLQQGTRRRRFISGPALSRSLPGLPVRGRHHDLIIDGTPQDILGTQLSEVSAPCRWPVSSRCRGPGEPPPCSGSRRHRAGR